MNLALNLKIRKPSDQLGHRRTRTDYANVKKLVDNFTKPSIPDSSQKVSTTKCVQLGLKVKEKSIKLGHNRANNKSSFGQSYVVTQHYQKPTARKNESFNAKIDLSFKRIHANLIQTKETKRPTQVVVQKPENKYEWETKVGSGTFGTVHKARDKKTLEIVAIKKVFQDRKYKNRQLQILKTLKHPNVLEMKEHFFTYEGQKQYLNVVMDYFPTNLFDYIQTIKTKRLSKLKFKVIAFQLFRALLYLQQKRIAHRDIKPHNILLNQSDLKVVICDFGSAKVLIPGQQNISYICSRCYRAPQLIFQNTQYTTQIDVWSTGCVLIQIVTGVPIFRANSNIEQLIQIIKVLGTPTPEQILKMNPSYELNKMHLPKVPKKDWTKILKTNILGDQFIDLIEGIMSYSPSDRLTPYQVLEHSFFDELRIEPVYQYLRKQLNIPSLFNFAQQFKSSKYDGLVPQWYYHRRYQNL